jgi:histidyl-tRNA synthetase
VAGGGRYDGLIAQLGGPDVAATGFAIGMERLALLVPPVGQPAADFFVAVLDPAAPSPALALAQELREAGLIGETGVASGRMKSRMRAAARSGARWCRCWAGRSWPTAA